MMRALMLMILAAGALRAQGPDFDMPGKIQDFRVAAQRDSNDPAAHYNYALWLWKIELYDKADSEFRTAIRLDPDFAPPFVGIYAMTYTRWPDLWNPDAKIPPDVRRKAEEADRLFRHAIVTDPLVDLKPLGAALPPVPAGVYIRPGLAFMWNMFGRWYYLLLKGFYAPAYSNLNRLISQVPRDSVPADLLMWHGIAAEHLDLDSVAELDFQAIVDRADSMERSNRIIPFPISTAEYDYLLATVQYRRGEAPRAVKYLHDALVADVGLYEAHNLLAEIAEAGEDWDDAIAERRAAVDAAPDNPRFLVHLANTFLKAGRDSDAEAPLREAVAANGRDFGAEFILGVVEMHLGKTAEARTALTAAIALTPSRFTALLDDAKKRLASLPQ